MRRLLSVLFLLAFASGAHAQTPPSESRIKADAKEHVKSNATSVTIRGDGTREWNDGAWEYYRSITIRSPYSEMPGVEIENYGDIVYQSHGSSYAYHDYRVGDWRYFGIPDPSPEEVEAILMTDPAKAYPHGTLDQGRELTFLSDEETYWHNPTSVTVPVEVRYKKAVSYTEVAENVARMDVRLYRETADGPWESFISTTESDEELSRETFSANAVREMRTLRDAAIIAEREAAADALPTVEVPTFRDGEHLATHTYQMLRESDPATLRAYLLAVLAPRHFVSGSTTALGAASEQMVDQIVQKATGGEITFAMQTCPTPNINRDRTRRSRNRTYFYSVLDVPPRGSGSSVVLEVVDEEAPGGYRNGQALPGRVALGDLKVYVSDDRDDLAWLQSFDDPSAMCQQNAVDGARDTVESTVDRARRGLGRLLGRD